MQINLTVYGTGLSLINNNLRFIAYQTDTPTVPAEPATTFAPPQTFPRSVTLTVPNPVPHFVKIFSSPDASPGTLLADFLYDPSYASVEIRHAEQIVVGGIGPYDPVVGATQINIPDAVGWDYWFERRANGGTQADGEYTQLLTGGVELSRAGDTFGDGEIMFIHFYPRITTATPVFNYLNLFTDIIPITSATVLDATFAGKLLEITEPGTSFTIPMPALVDVPDMKVYSFSTFMGNQKQAKITGAFKYLNQPMAAVYMGTQESFVCIKKGDAYHIHTLPEGMLKVGAYIYSDSKLLMANAAYCDGSALPIADYPRVDYWLSQLPPGIVFSTAAARSAGTAAQAFAKSSMWVRDTAEGNIYLPDKRGLSMRSLPENRVVVGGVAPFSVADGVLPGTAEVGQNLLHNHYTSPSFNRLSARADDVDSAGTPNGIDSSGAGMEYKVGAMSSGGNDQYWPLSIIKDNGGVQSTVTGSAHYVLVSI